MMNKKVKAIVMAMAVSMISAISVCAAEPAPAFDSPQQEAAAYRAAQAQQAWADMYATRVNGENQDYHAVPAFDSPQQEAAAYRTAQAQQAWADMYATRVNGENQDYHAVNNNTGK